MGNLPGGAKGKGKQSMEMASNDKMINPTYEVILWAMDLVQGLTLERVKDLFLHAPRYYNQWWRNLYAEAPLHILIETGMILFIIWLMFIRRTVDPKKSSKNDKLSIKEVEWLVETWEPEPLVPALTESQVAVSKSKVIVDGYKNGYLTIRGIDVPVLNVSSFDFLGLGQDASVKNVSKEALAKYGCGSCGPRGFYGTIDKHLEFEKALSKFMHVPEAISYSDSASAISSAIPAFAKKGDLLLVDEACNEPILTGLNLSRATVQTFKHNNMADLKALLESIAKDDARLRRDKTQQRRFIVTEGLFRNTGELCPLPEIMALKEEHCFRLILDESLSFGSVGATGRGVTEHFKVNIGDVEIITIAMDTALASVGGACIGSREIVDHQRLSGAGYCFSAAGPPFLSAAATEALRLLEANPSLPERLQSNAAALDAGLRNNVPGMSIRGPASMPVTHLMLDPSANSSREDEEKIIMEISKRCLQLGTGVSTCKFSLVNSDHSYLRPSLRVCASALLTEEQIETTIKNIKQATAEVMASPLGRSLASTSSSRTNTGTDSEANSPLLSPFKVAGDFFTNLIPNSI